jgi:hypothetical protein
VTRAADQLQGLLDTQAIQAALARYCRGVDRADAELIASAYHPDAIDEHGAHTFQGENIGQGILEMTCAQRITFHSITNTTIQFHSPDEAGCEAYYNAWQTMELDGRERILVAVGRYLDRFERRGADWRIAHRRVVVDLASWMPDAAFTASSPDLGERGSQDPSYSLLRSR